MQAAPIGSTAVPQPSGLLGTANAVCCVLHVLEEACKAAFTLFDVDSDGLISREDLAYLFAGQNEPADKRPPNVGDSALQLLGSTCTELNRVLLEGEANGQGAIDFQKFKFMMMGFNGGNRGSPITFAPQAKQVRQTPVAPVPPKQAPPDPECRSPVTIRKLQVSPPTVSPNDSATAVAGMNLADHRSSCPVTNGRLSLTARRATVQALPSAGSRTSKRHSVGTMDCAGTGLLLDPSAGSKPKGNLTRAMTSKSPLPGQAPTNLVRSATVLFGRKNAAKAKRTQISDETDIQAVQDLDDAGDKELSGPNPLWEIFKQKKINMKKLKQILETDDVRYLNTCLCVEEDVPQAIFVAVALRQPEMVKILVNSHADVTKRMPCKKAWKHVKPNQTVLDVNEGQKGRYVGTVLYERCEAIQSLLKAEEDRQRGWRNGLRASSAAQRYFDEDHQNESGVCDIEKEEAAEKEEAKPKTAQEIAAAEAELALSKKTLYSAQATFVCQHITGSPADHYTIGAVEGEGTFGIVSVAWDKLTSFERAVKKVPKTLLEESDLWQEIEIMRDLDHPYVTRLYTTYEDSDNIYMIMENCAGGELFDAVMEAGNLLDDPCRTIFRQMLVATSYLHTNSICHRDLKPENFLLSRSGEPQEACVKLIDFGTARRFSPEDPMTTKICTIHYAAPEILAKHTTNYTEKCDMWSLGICLYVMLSGNLPFAGDSDTQVLRKARKGKFEYEPEEIWDDVPDDTKAIVKSLLVLEPSERSSAHDLLAQPWSSPPAARVATKLDYYKVVRRLLDFHQSSWLKQTSLELVASQLPEESVEDLRIMWFQLDAVNAGRLRHIDILHMSVEGHESERAELLSLLEHEDAKRHQDVSYTSFLAAMLNAEGRIDENACRAAFALLDLDDDCLIRLTELGIIFTSNHMDLAKNKEASKGKNKDQLVLSLPHLEGHLLDECQKIINMYDVNKDQALDFTEFMTMMKSSAKC